MPGSPPVNCSIKSVHRRASSCTPGSAGSVPRCLSASTDSMSSFHSRSALFYGVVTQLDAPLFESLQLFGRVVLLHSGHYLQCVDEVVDGRLDGPIERDEDCFEPSAKLPLKLDLTIRSLQMPANRRSHIEPVAEQTGADVVQPKADLPQGEYSIQTSDVALVVQTMTCLRARRRPEETEVVVVVQGAHRQARLPCEITDLHCFSLITILMTDRVGPHVT
jgi:hypothetical protein